MGLQVLHAYRSDSLVRGKAEKPWFQWQPDWSYLLDEYTRFTTMEEVVIEFIPGLRFRKMDGVRRLAVLTEERIGYTIGNSLVLLDGIPITDHEIIFKYDPLKSGRSMCIKVSTYSVGRYSTVSPPSPLTSIITRVW